jgi:membrane associated rhomboid family serine protease
MLPIRDRNPVAIVPYVTYSLIVANVLFFLLEFSLNFGGQLDPFIERWAMVPRDILAGGGLITLLTSMFLHGGIMHVFGNMLYLFVFGNNIEEALGHGRFLVFYLFCGLCASSLHILFNASSGIPTLGASGAIAGVLGAYVILFPRAKVDTLIFAFFITWITLPAAAVLVFWFVLQVFSGVWSIVGYAAGGVAYFAHVGGFVAGALLVLPLRGRVKPPPKDPPRLIKYDRYGEPYWR